MTLLREFERTGNKLFRYRSYIPLFLYIILVPVLFFERDEFFHYRNVIWGLSCLLVSLSGILVRALTIGFTPQNTSGRNTKQQVAEQLNTKGMYSLIRHPLYLGNFLMWLGLILYVGSIEFLIFSVFFFWLYYERIMFAEERFIESKFGKQFIEWASQTPSFLPNTVHYKKTGVSFSFKNVVKREYHGFYATILSFVLVHLLKKFFYIHSLSIDKMWLILFIAGTFIYVIIRIIVKKTKWLHVEGR